MNEKWNDVAEDIRMNVVLPKQKDYKVVAISNPATANTQIDGKYNKAINQHIQNINNQYAVLERDKSSLSVELEQLMQAREPVEYDGQRTYRLYNSMGGAGRQREIDLFQEFNSQGGSYFAFDIETVGDSQDRVNPYGITEIAIAEYDEKGNRIQGGQSYNALVRQGKDVIDDLQADINRMKTDPYYYNTLPEYKKRSIVDLMRYSTHIDGNDANAFSSQGGVKHHSIIDSVFNYQDQVDHRKVVQNMHHYIPYMESGLKTLSTQGVSPEKAMDEVSNIMRRNRDRFFVSYNGNMFDMPVMQAYANRMGVDLPNDVKHLDYLNLIRSTYTDSDDLKRQINPDYKGSLFEKNKLAAFREILPQGTQDGAHNADVDIDDTGRLVGLTREPIQKQIHKNHRDIQSNLALNPTETTWNKDPLRHGQQLFASGGVMAYRDGDESFRMKWDADKKQWVQASSGFNKTVVNSRSFYRFAGLEELGEDKLAFRFYDPERQELSYIVRQGQNAYQELQDFVQSRFYNWDNADPNLKQEIQHVAETDRARRRYDRFFSMDGAGRGLSVDADGNVIERGTAGYSGLKRMLENAEVIRDYLDSNGKPYRDRVRRYREEGMTESQAKEAARLVKQDELEGKLKFDSMWNNELKKYEFNPRERDAFFKMYGRLIDELPYLNQAVQEIDEAFNEEISQAAKIQDGYNRREALKEINQRRDRALMLYQQQIIDQVGTPEVERKLQPFEGHRLSFYDPEVNDRRTLNFESMESARNSIYGYARRGVEENNPNRPRVMRERANHLISNLHSQNIISSEQRNYYQDVLRNNQSVWNATEEIAIDMRRRAGGQYETTRIEPSLTSNEAIQKVSMSQNQSFIQQAIQDANNANAIIHMGTVEGKQLELNQQLRNHLDILDNQQFSRLNPNNYAALEEVVRGIRSASPHAHVAIAMDPDSADRNLKIYAYDSTNSVSVQNQLIRGVQPTQAVEINLPLINEAGTHRIGGRVINAHSMASYEDGNIRMISSAEHIARGYRDNIHRIMREYREGNIEGANKLARRTLNDQVENMSGIQRNIVGGPNDSYAWANNLSDQLKQSHLKVGSAMVQDFYYNGYDGIRLTEDDFYDPDSVFRTDRNGNRVLRNDVQLSDINMNTQHSMLMKMTKWAEERIETDDPNFKVFTSALKAEHVAAGTVSLEDIRHIVPYGSFYNHGRDNMVQYMNAYAINDGVINRIQGIRGVDRNQLLETERYHASGRGNIGINLKTAYMTQDELRSRIDGMFATSEGRKLLGDVGLLTESGELNHLKLPRLYEQQGIIAQDVMDALTVDNEKRYAKGNQFEIDESLRRSSSVIPGQLLGTRISDSGSRENVYYEGNRPAQLISGLNDGEDLLLRWENDPFKLMLDGEKMTDSPVDRRFIQALTGQDDIAAIINPDVAKHRDFGMLMSGNARLLAEHVRNTSSDVKRKRLIEAIEAGGVGLKWNASKNMFMDHSFGMNIHPEAFDNLFNQLGISNKTKVGGYEYGILEAHLSKVENYSKVIDSTGRRVINLETEWDEMAQRERVIKTYGREDGVQWGHREMGVLRSQGMEKTYEHVHQIMIEQGRAREGQGLGRLEESRNIAESLRYMTHEERANVQALSIGDFESLPEQYRNDFTYKGTIFDREAVHNAVERQVLKHGTSGGIPVNEHGFWLELPTVQRSDGKTRKVSINLTGDSRTEIDKIFIPFTNLEGANGNTHLRNLQKQIANIYDKADAVTRAGSATEARSAYDALDNAVQGYMRQSFHDLSASSGLLFGDAFRASMGADVNGVKTMSASGLFKLMDFETSQKYGEGQHTVISEDMARKMGIYDQLKEGKELYTANVRYPTFHDGAMQFTKLHMSADVKDGEMHTTSFSSMLQNADSDGDYSHITVIDDDAVQQEWKKAHDEVDRRFAARWEDHRRKEDPTHPEYKGRQMGGVRLSEVSPEGSIPRTLPTDRAAMESEMASKVGKMTIGRASNLNLFIRQIADGFYQNDPEMNRMMKRFGEGLEQKLIDAKHGAEPVGLKMIDHIYRGEWEQALAIDSDERYFGGMFQRDYHMREVASEMPMALQRVRNGLYTQGMKFGTSTGISPKYGLQNFIDLLYGDADPKDFGGRNQALEMLHKYLRDNEGMSIDRFGHSEDIPKIERLTETPMRDRVENTKGLINNIRNIASDSIGGGISDLGGKVRTMFENVQNMGGKRLGLLGAGLAVAGIAGYNILSTEKPEMHYNNVEVSEQSSASAQPQPALQVPAGEMGTQNASVQVQASGGNISQDQLSHAVTQGMMDTGMQAGPTRVSINYQDNTQQLNRQWYRDTVRENI